MAEGWPRELAIGFDTLLVPTGSSGWELFFQLLRYPTRSKKV